jgi:hypothetical protein
MRTPAITLPIHAADCLCAAFIAVVVCGCATPAVWHGTAALRWDPCPPVDVLLVPGTNQTRQVAFFFTQSSTRGTSCRTRPVLWLPASSATNLVVDDASVRAFLKARPAVRQVPVYGSPDQLPLGSTETGEYAISDELGLTLTLHAEGFPPGPYTMPATDQKAKTAARIIGLPLAAALDAALVTAAAVAGAGASGGMFIPSF